MAIPDGFWTVALEATVARMNQNLIQFDITANRPAAGTKGLLFIATDGSKAISYDNGSAWVEDIAPASVLKSTVTEESRTAAAATASIAYTGAGFTPTGVIIAGGGTSDDNFSIGFGDDSGTGEKNFQARALAGTPVMFVSTLIVQGQDSTGSNRQEAVLESLDSDGITLGWTKIGSGEAVDFAIFYLR